jgi:hypothetical protein
MIVWYLGYLFIGFRFFLFVGPTPPPCTRVGAQVLHVCHTSTLPLSYTPKLLFILLNSFESSLPGWLHKEVKNSPKMSSLKLKKRWFVLTHNSLDYYKSSEKNALKLGTLVLNSLCSVVPPDEKIFKETGNHTPSWSWKLTTSNVTGLHLLWAKE